MMLTGTHVAFLGGDARQLEVIEQLTAKDAVVSLIGFDQLQHQIVGVKKVDLTPELMTSIDVLILPTVVHENGKIDTLFSSEEIYINEQTLQQLPDHALVYTGFAKPFLKEWCSQNRIELIELFDRDDVAIYNSIPTAEGALMMAIENTDFTIHGSKSMVLGLGRTGLTMARTLRGIGAEVTVGVRKSEHAARAIEMGFKPIHIQKLDRHVKEIDLLFNTIPTMIVTAKVIANLPHHAVIIDLASKPGGTDFRFAEKRGIKALLAPGLPGIVAPRTAGRIIANCIIQILSEKTGEMGDSYELEG